MVGPDTTRLRMVCDSLHYRKAKEVVVRRTAAICSYIRESLRERVRWILRQDWELTKVVEFTPGERCEIWSDRRNPANVKVRYSSCGN